MRRRELLLAAPAMMAGRAVRAQQKAMPVIGYLGGTSLGPYAHNVAAVRQGLNETGFFEGQNVAIEYVGRRADMIGCRHWPPSSLAARST